MTAETETRTLVGRVIADKFRIESLLGEGGMGEVYRGRWLELDQVVAIKVVRQQLVGDSGFATRFRREAKAASRLDHPNSVRIIDFGVHEELHYMVMEYVEGGHLLAEIEEGWPLTNERVVHIVSQVLGALAKAHDLGILHRDLKPENILISNQIDDEGHSVVKVCDFGIAKIMTSSERDTQVTNMGLILGTPEYMSPEQGAGDALDARSDVYAMGVILYQLLTRTLPFDAETPLGLLFKHASSPLVPPIEIRPEVDPKLDAVVRRAMEKKPADRYASAREMRVALRQAIGKEVGSHAGLAAKQGPPKIVISALSTARTLPAVDTTEPSSNELATGATKRVAGPTIFAIALLSVLLLGGVGIALLRHPAFAKAASTGAPSAEAEPKPEPKPVPVASAATPVPSATTQPSSLPAAPASIASHEAVAPHAKPPPVSVRAPVISPTAKTIESAVASVQAPPPPTTPPPKASSTKPVIEKNPY